MIPRTLTPTLRRSASAYPVLTLTGPRQSGKTTLIRETFSDHEYASLEDPDQRAFALRDPRGFLGQFEGPAILDEVQRAPELFSYIQTLVDQDDTPGRFILTGSQNFLLLRSVSQSLAGRCAIHHLLPFSISELEGRQPINLRTVGAATPPKARHADRDLMETLWRGGYPRIHDKQLPAQQWLHDYTRTYLERDVREILNVGDLSTFELFVRLCAGRNGQLLNLSSLATDAGVTHTTARRWLSVLESSFLVMRLQPHHRNFRKRLVKTPKLYFLDTGLLCSLLRIREPREVATHAARGSLFESLVVSEFVKAALHRGEPHDLTFWRDSNGHEVDLIVERGTEPLPVEIKSGQTVPSDAFKGLDYWRGLAERPDAPALLIHGGDRSMRDRGVVVQSWRTL